MIITCTALPETLLESELFGHERGAFTDAKQLNKGRLELANGGTVFLDEIGDMGMTLQSKMLRFLEEKAFKRVGGNGDLRVDVRVIAATNKDLPAEIRAGRFREDLYFRLNVIPIFVPPLRERQDDIERLTAPFIQQLAREYGRRPKSVDPECDRALSAPEVADVMNFRW